MRLMLVSGCCAGSLMNRASCTMRDPALSVSNPTLRTQIDAMMPFPSGFR